MFRRLKFSDDFGKSPKIFPMGWNYFYEYFHPFLVVEK